MGRLALLVCLFLFIAVVVPAKATEAATGQLEPRELQLPTQPGRRKNWLGTRSHPQDLPILVMAGHADSQRLRGSGTPGEAVGIYGARPMDPAITDELYWNLLTAQKIVQLGRERGLNIRYYDPGLRTLPNSNDPRSNWSVGYAHAEQGGYAVEIHYDAHSPHGGGAGVIPAVRFEFSRLDEALSEEFGGYPYDYRGMLGAPRRGISILEIANLEGNLERNLRNPRSSEATLKAIAERVVKALQKGLANSTNGSTSLQQ
jgi:hypothetical protein